MSYDIGNLGLKGDRKSRTWLYVAVVVIAVVVVIVATKLAALW